MLEVIKYVTSGFWVFVGTTILISIPIAFISETIISVVKVYFRYLSNKQPK